MGNEYLVCYNSILCMGWGYCLYLAMNCLLSGGTLAEFWTVVEVPLKIFQTAACLEILHSAVGLVRSPLMVTTLQVFSRIWILWGIINPVQSITTTQSLELIRLDDAMSFKLDLLSLVSAWSMAEVIRYGFFALKELEIDSSLFKWLRYTGFIVLYPLGVSSELALVFLALPLIKSSKLWSLDLPNRLNYGFDYSAFCYIGIISYIPFFPQLYFYMLAQRKKVLSGKPKSD